MERKVGEVFNYGNDILKVVACENCNDCFFKDKACSDDDCSYDARSDKKSVIFKKIGELK